MTSSEIHAISGANINSHFADCAADRSNITEVAEADGVKAGKDSRLCTYVAQVYQPFVEGLGPLDLVHGGMVSVWIRPVKAASVRL